MKIKNALVLDSRESLSKAISELMDTGTAVIITKEGRYHGIIDDRSLSCGFGNANQTRCETVIVKPPVLSPSASIIERSNSFLSGHFKALPIVDESGYPLGLTTRVELVDDMLHERMIPKTNVSNMMSAPVYTIDENDTVSNAKNLMKRYECNRLVVTRNGNLIGIISTLDLAAEKAFYQETQRRMAVSEPKNIDTKKVKEFFRPDLAVVQEASTVEDAARRMVEKGVSSIIVVADKKLVGVISAVDLFKNLQKLASSGIEIEISGLPEEERSMYPQIQDKVGSVLDKFSASFEIRNPRLHIKEGKSVYSVRIYLDIEQGHISLSSERNTLKQSVDEIAEELDNVLERKKSMRKAKKRKVHKTKPIDVRRRR